MVGATFRPQGCDPKTGLDCVGLVWAAYAMAGCVLERPRGYPLRGWSRNQVEAGLVRAGFVPVAEDGCEGDVMLFAYPAGQFHLGLTGLDRLVHAHAGLRRVVETPLDDAMRGMACWRLEPRPRRCD